MRTPKSPLTTAPAAALVSLLLLSACGHTPAGELPAETGRVSVALTVGPDDEIDELHYVVEDAAGEALVSRTLTVAGEETVDFQLVLPEGNDYRLVMTATTRSGFPCQGVAGFDVVAGQVADVPLTLVCGAASEPRSGGARVTVTVETDEACPEIAAASASHLVARVGKAVELQAQVTAGGEPTWSSTAGAIADPAATETTFTCSEEGEVTVTLELLAEPDCERSATFEIVCTPEVQEPTLVEYTNGHGDFAMRLSPDPDGGFEVSLEAEGATIDGVPDTGGEFDIEDVLIITDATFARPDADNGAFAPLCVEEGERLFWLPQGNNDASANDVPLMGIALESDLGVFVDDQVTLKLVGVTAPMGDGHYSLWKDGFPPTFSMSSCDGIGAEDELVVPVGHDHFNTGLSGAPGDWLITYEVAGELASGGSASQQFSVRYRTVSTPLRGNVSANNLPASGSVGFIIVDGGYELFTRPGWNATSVNFVDSNRKFAYGWSRDKHYSDPTETEQSWRLDLATMTFETLEIPGAIWTVTRNAREDGTVVGKLGHDSGTPDDTSDDVRYGFIHSWETGETTLVAREGFDDIGFSGINDEGVVVGFNDFGLLGFVYRDGEFEDLTHPGAFRLFPFQITNAGTIVGFMGLTSDDWFNSQLNPAFIAEPATGGYAVTPYEIDGASGTGLTARNERGDLAGIYYPEETSTPIPFRVPANTGEPEFFPFQPGPFEPFVTGITEDGLLHGEIYILSEPEVCGGHGSLEDSVCVCEAGYQVDPVDPENCIAVDAECSGHGHLHGDVCHCDSGYVVDPADSGACVPA